MMFERCPNDVEPKPEHPSPPPMEPPEPTFIGVPENLTLVFVKSKQSIKRKLDDDTDGKYYIDVPAEVNFDQEFLFTIVTIIYHLSLNTSLET